MYSINLYLFGSFLGYFHESFLKRFFFPSIHNGLLHGPWIPIYGFGFLFIHYISCKVSELKISTKRKSILLFFLLSFSLMILEELGGVMIELLFHKVFWDYSKLPFHIGHYLSLEICIVWGFLSLLIVWYLNPFLELFLKKIPFILSIGILFLQIIDFVSILLFS